MKRKELLPRLAALAHRCPKLRNVVYFESRTGAKADVAAVTKAGLTATPFSVVEGAGKRNRGKVTLTPPQPDDLAILMYTSGSTGDPKVYSRSKSGHNHNIC